MENEKQVIALLTKMAEVVAQLLEARMAYLPKEYIAASRADVQELHTLSKAILQPSQQSRESL